MQKHLFYLMGLVTLFGFSSLGAAILYFVSDVALLETFHHGWNWYYQLPLGLIFGLLAGIGGWAIISLKLMQPVREKYTLLFDDMSINWFDILFISFCAGYGEEILFRACVQYYWGVIPTAIFFVAIHGYLNPKNWRLSIYGGYLTIVIIIIGYAYESLGLIFAIAAHFMIDVLLLYKMTLSKTDEKNYPSFPDEPEQ